MSETKLRVVPAYQGPHERLDMHPWLLVFPPLLPSNWGNYYPSTAVLAGSLAAGGFRSLQLDLNLELLDDLLDPIRLGEIEAGHRAGHRAGGRTSAEEILRRAAAQLLRAHRELVFDDQDRIRDFDSGIGRELVMEVARSLHINEPVAELVSPRFDAHPRAARYREFFARSSLSALLEGDVGAVGISVPMGSQLGPSVLLARFIKARRPKLPVVIGGPTLTLMDPASLRALITQVPEIDAIVRFEGERALLELSRQLQRGRWAPGKIPGVCARDDLRVDSGSRPFRARAVPPPRYEAALMGRLASPRLGVMFSRGCYWGECSHCDFVALYSDKRKYDGRQPRAVVDEIEELVDAHGVDRFRLITEAIHPRLGQRFAQEVLARGLNIDWRSSCMVDEGFDAALLSEFVESGCTGLTVGLDTNASRVLSLVRKRADRSANLRFLDAARSAGLPVDVNLIPNLPTTTHAEAMATLADMRAYADVFSTVSVSPFEATCSSEIGRSPGDSPGDWGLVVTGRVVHEDPGMSSEELAEVMSAYEQFAAEVARSGARRRGRLELVHAQTHLPGLSVAPGAARGRSGFA